MHSNLICIQDSLCIFLYIYFLVDWGKVNFMQTLRQTTAVLDTSLFSYLKYSYGVCSRDYFMPAAVFPLLLVREKQKKKTKRKEKTQQNTEQHKPSFRSPALHSVNTKWKSCCCFSSHFSIGSSICSKKPGHKQYFCLKSFTVKTRQTPYL